MSTKEKVGQLFVKNVYGSDADDRRRRATSRCTASPRRGRRAQVPPRRGHLLRLDRQRQGPGPDHRPVQRPAARGHRLGRAHPADGRHRPGAGHGHPDRAAGHAVPRLDGPRRLAAARPTPAPPRRSPARELRGDGHQRRLRPGRRRQRQPAQPGDRHPLLRLRPGAGLARWSPRRSRATRRTPGSSPRRSTSPATATPPPTATPGCRSSRTPARSGSRLDAPPFRAAIRAGIDIDHERRTSWSRRWTRPVTRPRCASRS